MPERDERQEAFLAAFVERDGDLEEARKDADLSKALLFSWLRTDQVFRDRFDSYRLALAEQIENEAVKRVLNPTAQRGSDALATTLLRGLKKERYGEAEKGVSATAVVYVSGLRDKPRQGVTENAGPTGEAVDAAVPSKLPEHADVASGDVAVHGGEPGAEGNPTVDEAAGLARVAGQVS